MLGLSAPPGHFRCFTGFIYKPVGRFCCWPRTYVRQRAVKWNADGHNVGMNSSTFHVSQTTTPRPLPGIDAIWLALQEMGVSVQWKVQGRSGREEEEGWKIARTHNGEHRCSIPAVSPRSTVRQYVCNNSLEFAHGRR